MSSEDYSRNELDIYEKLWSLECNGYVPNLFCKSMEEIKQLKYEEAFDVLEGLCFIQYVGATALWKYHHKINHDLECFVRDFDRLDVLKERERLYKLAQISHMHHRDQEQNQD